MVEVETGRFTVGVFQDVAWAQKGVDALKQAGFPQESLTILAKESAEVAGLIERALGAAGDRLELVSVGAVLARGPLVEALQGTHRDLPKVGLSGAMRRRRVGDPAFVWRWQRRHWGMDRPRLRADP